MASARTRAPAASEPVVLSPPAFARSTSGRLLPGPGAGPAIAGTGVGAGVEFGSASPVGAHTSALHSPEYAPDAFAAARARARASALASPSFTATPSPSQPPAPPRQVPKRLREANTVEALTGLIHELPVPSAVPVEHPHALGHRDRHGQADGQADGQDSRSRLRARASASADGGSNTNDASGTSGGCTLADQFSALEVQKRRRRCDGEHERVHTHAATPSGVGVDMTDDLCFLVDQVAIKDAKTDEKFMPYIV